MLAPLVRSLDRRYLAGVTAGVMVGFAVGIPAGYALLQGSAPTFPTQVGALRVVSLINESYRAIALEQPEYALSVLRQAEEIDPKNATLQNNLCVALNGLHRYDEAILACGAALSVQPDFELARQNLAWAKLERAKAP